MKVKAPAAIINATFYFLFIEKKYKEELQR